MNTPPEHSALQRMQALIAEGHAMEAAEYAKLIVHAMPEDEVRAMLCALADYVATPDKQKPARKRGDKFVNRTTFEKLAAEIAISDKVAKSGQRVTVAFDQIGQDKKGTKSVGTVKRLYYKHKVKRST